MAPLAHTFHYSLPPLPFLVSFVTQPVVDVPVLRQIGWEMLYNAPLPMQLLFGASYAIYADYC